MVFIGNAPREQRRNVSLPASLRGEGPRCDVVIRNLSARGMTILVRGMAAPPRGSYVDIRRGTQTMTGQVRWRQGDAIGVRLRDAVDLGALTGVPGPGQAVHRAPLSASMTVQPRAERSRMLSSALQFGAIVAVPLAIAAIAGPALWEQAIDLLRTLHDALG